MNTQPQLVKVSDMMSKASRIGIIGSPSSTTEVCLEIMGHSVGRKLVGELVLFNYEQDGTPHHALGQINEVRMSNIWHETPTIRSLARQRGKVDHVSAQQDTHQGKMTVSSVFKETIASDGVAFYGRSMLGTVPATGTPVCVADDKILKGLLHPYREQMFYLGNVYGSTPKMPMWFKHFGRGPSGLSEAYHLGIFGMTGAGKSTLAKMVMLAYAKHPEMAILVLDPKGEFSKDVRNFENDQFPIRYEKTDSGIAVWPHKKPVTVLTVGDLVLDTWDLFFEILMESRFFERLQIRHPDNRGIACRILREGLEGKKLEGEGGKVTLTRLHERKVFEQALRILGDSVEEIYTSPDKRKDVQQALQKIQAESQQCYDKDWEPTANLFNKDRPGGRRIDGVLHKMLNDSPRPMVMVDLSEKQAKGILWNHKIQSRVIHRLLGTLKRLASQQYQGDESLNTLVVIDEARRLAPRELSAQDDIGRSVRDELIDAVQTTRAYGLGWMFISPTLHGLDKEIIQSLRIKFFGFGLGMGSEFNMLRDMAGSSGPALELYRTFSDPHSAPDASSRQYSFMTVGPVSPLSFSGSPLFFNVFNSRDKFIEANFPENNEVKNRKAEE